MEDVEDKWKTNRRKTHNIGLEGLKTASWSNKHCHTKTILEDNSSSQFLQTIHGASDVILKNILNKKKGEKKQT